MAGSSIANWHSQLAGWRQPISFYNLVPRAVLRSSTALVDWIVLNGATLSTTTTSLRDVVVQPIPKNVHAKRSLACKAWAVDPLAKGQRPLA